MDNNKDKNLYEKYKDYQMFNQIMDGDKESDSGNKSDMDKEFNGCMTVILGIVIVFLLISLF